MGSANFDQIFLYLSVSVAIPILKLTASDNKVVETSPFGTSCQVEKVC